MCINKNYDIIIMVIIMEVIIGVSNRHVHLTREHLNILFGENYELKEEKKLNQPGQFAATDTVIIKTKKNQFNKVRIVGPCRNYTQVEISKTDAYFLGLNPPIRDAGDIEGSSPITIIGPKGELNLNEGCIIPTRHIHITPKQMQLYGFEGLTKVDVLIEGEKTTILKDVHLKVAEASYYEMHLDTDDANANLVKNGSIATIIKSS